MPRLPAYKVRITPRALRDLDGIYDYLIDNASPQVAKTELARLMSAIRGLRVLPYRFAVPRTGKPRGIAVRAMVVLHRTSSDTGSRSRPKWCKS